MNNYKQGGYVKKYIISKANGKPTDPNADYFVLRLDKDPHALKAMITYANSVLEDNEQLSNDIKDKLVNDYHFKESAFASHPEPQQEAEKEETYRRYEELIDWLETECQSTETADLSHSFVENLWIRLNEISYMKINQPQEQAIDKEATGEQEKPAEPTEYISPYDAVRIKVKEQESNIAKTETDTGTGKLVDMPELRQNYHLNCDKCGKTYWSQEGFPKPQFCYDCSKQEKQTAEEEIINLLNKYTTTSLSSLTDNYLNFCIDPMDYHKIAKEYASQKQQLQ
jgi:acetyl-CoA carboxylase beta subunit